ncbi:metal-dependent hydrolase [Undibacterium sp. Ji22W]|uniref:metal-dependent hydrolase n=1 Tax=Undibacterium sp. Ji22W TaxID=3413038 RepID=UPI003BF09773
MTSSFSTSPIALSFPVPNLVFEGCDPQRWNGGSIVKSQFWNSMSSLLPNIEFCAIRSLMPMMQHINDSKLRSEVRLFCDQENAHGTLHSHFNREHLHTNYPLLKSIEAWERHCFSWMSKFLPQRLFLSLFVAVEHWTAAFSQHGLCTPDAWFAESDRTMFQLWEWHAVEELAHKSVCYDVYRYFKGGYVTQVMGMLLLLLFIMLPGICVRLVYLFSKDKVWWHLGTYRELAAYLLGRQGVLRKTFKDFLRFFNPRFRPWDINSLPLIEAYLTQRNVVQDTQQVLHKVRSNCI